MLCVSFDNVNVNVKPSSHNRETARAMKSARAVLRITLRTTSELCPLFIHLEPTRALPFMFAISELLAN